MKKFIAAHEIVIDLQERGFCHDFRLIGNDLYWIQGKSITRAGDFFIVEYYRFGNPLKRETEKTIFGILAFSCNAKGILINKTCPPFFMVPPVIMKKLNDLKVKAAGNIIE